MTVQADSLHKRADMPRVIDSIFSSYLLPALDASRTGKKMLKSSRDKQ